MQINIEAANTTYPIDIILCSVTYVFQLLQVFAFKLLRKFVFSYITSLTYTGLFPVFCFCKSFFKYSIALSIYNNIITFLFVKHHLPKTLFTVNIMGEIYLVGFFWLFFLLSNDVKVSTYLYTRVKIIFIPILKILYSKIFSALPASVAGSCYIELDKCLLPQK